MSFDEESILGHDRSTRDDKELNRLSQAYLVVYYTVMVSDWLQGPYLYKLYQSYGYTMQAIAYLYMTGFVSGAIAGTTMGGLADTWGRKKMCLIFCLTSSISLFLRIATSSFPILLVSHLLSGLSAGLLFTVFETWLVAEYQDLGFPSRLLDKLFATATFGNGLCAIIAGIVANWAVDSLGIQAPFMVAIGFSVMGALLISVLWKENYGISKEMSGQSLKETIAEGLKILFRGSRIFSLGLAQTLFECSMYIFVLLYTPALEQALENQDDYVPFGYLFSTLMVAVMLGSQLFRVLTQHTRKLGNSNFYWAFTKGTILSLTLAISAGSFGAMAFWANNVRVLTPVYHIFEFSVGIYFPVISSLKANLIPNDSRAAVMSLLRVPMNIGVCAILWQVDSISMTMLFAICACMNAIGAIIVGILLRTI